MLFTYNSRVCNENSLVNFHEPVLRDFLSNSQPLHLSGEPKSICWVKRPGSELGLDLVSERRILKGKVEKVFFVKELIFERRNDELKVNRRYILFSFTINETLRF